MSDIDKQGANTDKSLRFRWGHININVSDLNRAVDFYSLLGFEPYLPNIPYLGLERDGVARTMSDGAASALDLDLGARGRACIMQPVDGGYPKIDLTEFEMVNQREPLNNADLGLVRLCLLCPDVNAAYAFLAAQGVEFLSPPRKGEKEMATIVTCKDPDGSLIELLEVHRDKWPR